MLSHSTPAVIGFRRDKVVPENKLPALEIVLEEIESVLRKNMAKFRY